MSDVTHVADYHGYTKEAVIERLGLQDASEDVLRAVDFLFLKYKGAEECRKDAVDYLVDDCYPSVQLVYENGASFLDTRDAVIVDNILIASLLSAHFEDNDLPENGTWFEEAQKIHQDMMRLVHRQDMIAKGADIPSVLQDISEEAHFLYLVNVAASWQYSLTQLEDPEYVASEATQMIFSNPQTYNIPDATVSGAHPLQVQVRKLKKQLQNKLVEVGLIELPKFSGSVLPEPANN